MPKLTKRFVDSLKPVISDTLYRDDDLKGFALRVKPSGARTWVVQYDVAGRTRKMTLGGTDVLTAAKARAKAKDVLAAVRLGADPSGEKAEGRARQAETMGALLTPYLAFKRQELRPGSYVET